MKKILLLGILSGLLGWLPARAQVQDGTKYRGGTVSLNGDVQSNRQNTGNSNESSSSSHAITPEIQWGIFVNATTMIGLGGRYGFSRNRNRSGISSMPSSGSKETTIRQSVALLPFIRKYKPLGEH